MWKVLDVFITYYRLTCYLFFFRFGGSAVALRVSPAVFDRTQRRRENSLLPSWRSPRYVSLSRYLSLTFFVGPEGLAFWRTFLNLSKVMYLLAFSGSCQVCMFIFLFLCGYCGSPGLGCLKNKPSEETTDYEATDICVSLILK